MLSAVKEALFTPLMLENIETFSKTNDAKSDEFTFSQWHGYKCSVNLVVLGLQSV